MSALAVTMSTMFPEPPLVSAMEACIGVGCAVLPAGCAANVLPLSQVGGVDIVPCFLVC